MMLFLRIIGIIIVGMYEKRSSQRTNYNSKIFIVT